MGYLEKMGYKVNREALNDIEDPKERAFTESILNYFDTYDIDKGRITGKQILNGIDWVERYKDEYDFEGVDLYLETFMKMSKEKQALVFMFREALDFIDVYGINPSYIYKSMDDSERSTLQGVFDSFFGY